MSFIFSRALVEESLQVNCSAVDAFAPLSVIPTPKRSLLPGRTTEHLRLSRFGMTFEPLTDEHGAELLTLWLEAFPAKTSALPAPAKGSTESVQAYGPKWYGSFARFDRSESKWKTLQCSLLADSDEFLETWPRWGSMRNGESFLRPTWTPPTFESESGSRDIWPTPCAMVGASHLGFQATDGRTKPNKLGWAVAAKLWPTPTASLASKGGRITPRKSREGGTLIEAVSARAMWPTPCASASKGSSPGALTRKTGKSRANDRIDHAVMASDGGQLNPEWVEWLMGWPIGHTALEPLATAKYREWQQQHGKS